MLAAVAMIPLIYLVRAGITAFLGEARARRLREEAARLTSTGPAGPPSRYSVTSGPGRSRKRRPCLAFRSPGNSMPLRPLALAIALTVVSATAPAFAANAPQASQQAAKPARLNALYAQYWEELLRLNPLQATFQGDSRYNDQLPNFLSADYRAKEHEFNSRWLKTVESVGSDGLTGQDLLSYQIFVRDAKLSLESEQFPTWQQPINQFYNFASTAVQLGSGTGAQPFKTVADYENWRKRAAKIPAIFDQAIANSREGVKHGVIQPKALMAKVVPQLDALIKDKRRPDAVLGSGQELPERLLRRRQAAPDRRVQGDDRRRADAGLQAPAHFRRRRVHGPGAHTSGLGALPNGSAWYAFNTRNTTTTTFAGTDPPDRPGRSRAHPRRDRRRHEAGRLQGFDAGLLQVHAERPALQLQGRAGAAGVLSRPGSEDQPARSRSSSR
jgi:hypothetical protein